MKNGLEAKLQGARYIWKPKITIYLRVLQRQSESRSKVIDLKKKAF